MMTSHSKYVIMVTYTFVTQDIHSTYNNNYPNTNHSNFWGYRLQAIAFIIKFILNVDVHVSTSILTFMHHCNTQDN